MKNNKSTSMTIKRPFDETDPFYGLKSRALYDDARDAFAIEAKTSGMPHTPQIENAYLFCLQHIVDGYDTNETMLQLAEIAQCAPLEPVYMLCQHGQEYLDSHSHAENTESLEDIITSTLLLLAYQDKPENKYIFSSLTSDNAIAILDECQVTNPKRDFAEITFGALSASAETFALARHIYDYKNISNALQHEPRTDVAEAAILICANGLDLGVTNNTELGRQFLEHRQALQDKAISILKQPQPQEKPSLTLIK